jgi:ketosteroid isomerase-like protein
VPQQRAPVPSQAPQGHDLSKEEMIALCHDLISFRMKGDFKQVLSHFAPDCRFRLAGSSGVNPLSSVCIGHQQILEKIKTMNVLIEYCDIKPVAYVVDDDQFVVRWVGRWRNRGTGPAEDLEGVAHVRFRDGLIIDYTNFVDTAVIASLLDWPMRQPPEN